MARRLTLLTTVLALAVSPMALATSPAQALQAPVAFTSAALPTYQANGIAWAVAQAGGRVFVGGTFTSLRPPGAAKGTGETPRANFAVLDAASGEPTSCAPSFTLASSPSSATVRSLNVSPDGRTLYVGGYFSAVNGVARSNLAALDIASCSLVSAFRPAPNATVRTVRSTAGTVYFGGSLTKVGTISRAHAAAVGAVGTASPGTLSGWAPAFDLDLRALAIKPDDSVVLAGGEFNTVNGVASHALVALDATTGANVHTFGGGFSAAVADQHGPERGSVEPFPVRFAADDWVETALTWKNKPAVDRCADRGACGRDGAQRRVQHGAGRVGAGVAGCRADDTRADQRRDRQPVRVVPQPRQRQLPATAHADLQLRAPAGHDVRTTVQPPELRARNP